MTNRYHKPFFNLQKVSLISKEEEFGKVNRATIQIIFADIDITLTLMWPKLSPAVQIQWGELSEKLRDLTLLDVEVYYDPKDNTRPDEGLPWRLKISHDDETIAVINCKTIEGLPDH